MRTLVPEITEVIIDKRDEEIARRLLAFTSDNPAAGYDYFDEVCNYCAPCGIFCS